MVCSWNHEYVGSLAKEVKPEWHVKFARDPEYSWNSGFMLTLQETLSIQDTMKGPKIELIAYIYNLL